MKSDRCVQFVMKLDSCVQFRQLVFNFYKHSHSVDRDLNSKETKYVANCLLWQFGRPLGHIAVLALEVFCLFDFYTVLGYLLKFKVDKKCPELTVERHWFKTEPFKMFTLGRNISLNNSFFIL